MEFLFSLLMYTLPLEIELHPSMPINPPTLELSSLLMLFLSIIHWLIGASPLLILLIYLIIVAFLGGRADILSEYLSRREEAR